MAPKIKTPAKKQQEKSWFKDKYQFVIIQRNLFAILSIVCTTAAVLAVAAVYHIAPLKSVEPFIIQIDEKSGLTELVQPMTRESLTSPEQLDNFFLWRYVTARETYDTVDREYRVQTVRVLSKVSVFNDYLKQISPGNDASPTHMLGDFGTRHVENPTITRLNEPTRKIAQIHFAIREHFRSNDTVYNMLATIEFDYLTLNLNRDERLINPLGFQVKSYRLDDETIKH